MFTGNHYNRHADSAQPSSSANRPFAGSCEDASDPSETMTTGTPDPSAVGAADASEVKQGSGAGRGRRRQKRLVQRQVGLRRLVSTLEDGKRRVRGRKRLLFGGEQFFILFFPGIEVPHAKNEEGNDEFLRIGVR